MADNANNSSDSNGESNNWKEDYLKSTGQNPIPAQPSTQAEYIAPVLNQNQNQNDQTQNTSQNVGQNNQNSSTSGISAQIPSQKPKRSIVKIVIPLIVIIIGLVVLFMMLGGASYFETYSNAQALEEFTKAKNFFLSQETSDINNAVGFSLNSSAQIGLKDLAFFESKLPALSSTGDSEKRYALVKAYGAGMILISIGTIAQSKYLSDNNFTTNVSSELLLSTMAQDAGAKEFIDSVVLKSKSSVVNMNKVAKQKNGADGLSADFVNRSVPFMGEYLNQYSEFKENQIISALDSNRFFDALFEAQQLNALLTAYGE